MLICCFSESGIPNVNPENAKIMMKLKIYLCRNVGFNALILNVNGAANKNNPTFVYAGFVSQ